jgi:hypothetical protein
MDPPFLHAPWTWYSSCEKKIRSRLGDRADSRKLSRESDLETQGGGEIRSGIPSMDPCSSLNPTDMKRLGYLSAAAYTVH